MGPRDRHTQREDDVSPQGEDHVKMEDWSDASMGQGMSRFWDETPEARKRQAMIFRQVSEGAWHCQNIDVGLLTSRPVRQYISVTLSHQHMVFCYGSPRKVA